MMNQPVQIMSDTGTCSPHRFGTPHYASWARSRLLFVGDGSEAADLDLAGDVRVAAVVEAPQTSAHLRQMVAVDIVWLARAGSMESGVLTEIGLAAMERQCGLICETTLEELDRVVGAIPAALRTEFLVDASPAERLVALAAMQTRPRMAMHDVARDDAMERIDRLQEEVARISRLLGDLAGRGGMPGGLAPRGEEFEDYQGRVRSPTRDYAAVPRSFVPEERTIDRQRAKAVRRMLRQRRMREQYFPADMFADPAWDMLLDLYAARLERQPVSVSSLCIAAAVPATTALRWIKTMTDAGLFVREADPRDGRRIFIGLADATFDAMARYFEALEE